MKMRFFETIASRFEEAFHRFPLATIIAFVTTGLGLYWSHYLVDYTVVDSQWILAALFSLSLTFILVVAAYLLAETTKAKRPTVFLLIALLVGVGLYFWFDRHPDLVDRAFLDFFDLTFVALAIFSLAPFFGLKKMVAAKKENAYFGFLGAILNLLLSAFVYFGALYLGLVLLLLSLEFLFDLTLNDRWFLDLFVIITGLFVTHFVMAGLPKNFEKFEDKGLVHVVATFFPKYILVPLTWLYLVVLYAYMARIAMDMTWPESGVAGWIIGFSLVGILTEVILLRQVHEFAYVKALKKYFYWFLLPLIAVLYAALVVRVQEYGITEMRYFGLILATYISIVTVYNLASKLKSLRFMVGLLALMTVIAVMGPLSSKNMSFDSQIERLGVLFVENGVYVDGNLGELPTNVDSEAYSQMFSITNYLTWNLGMSSEMNEYFDAEEGTLEQMMGVGYPVQPEIESGDRQVNVYLDYTPDGSEADFSYYQKAYPTLGFDYFLPAFYLDEYTTSYPVQTKGTGFSIDGRDVSMMLVDGDLVVDGVAIGLRDWAEGIRITDNDNVAINDPEVLVYRFGGEGLEGLFFEMRFDNLNFIVGADGQVKRITSFNGNVLIRN